MMFQTMAAQRLLSALAKPGSGVFESSLVDPSLFASGAGLTSAAPSQAPPSASDAGSTGNNEEREA